MSTEASAESESATSPAGNGEEAKPGAPARLVYPPVAERRPSSRPVFAVAFAALVLLVGVGLLLVRQSLTSNSQSEVRSGTPTSAVGTHVVSQVAFGPGLVVSGSQHVVFERSVSSVTLTVPAQAAVAAGGAFDPRIGNVQILLDDGPPVSVRRALHAGGSVTVRLPASTTRLDVVFVAYGAVVRSKPSSQHRAAALATLLTLTPNAGTSTLHIDGANVTNIGCTAPDGTSTSCASEGSKGWTVVLGQRQQDDAVIAQLDLRP